MSVRTALRGSLALAPIAVAVELAGGEPTLVFALSALALVPLAWVIGEATDQAAHRTGPAIGGFLNATFGNVPELMVSLFAIADGLFEVVRGSLSGSVVGNLLLVLGMSLAVGGEGRVERRSIFISLALTAVAAALYLVPAAPSWFGSEAPAELALPVAAALLVGYAVVTWRTLAWHGKAERAEDETAWSLTRALVTLAVATAATAAVAELLVGSLEHFAEAVNLGDFFVAAVIVAFVANAAEHGGAVIIARRGEIRLASEIALRSASQVAAGLIPAVVLLSWLFEPFPLDFRAVEIVALAGGAALVALILGRGCTSRARGAALLAGYAVAAAAFYAFG